MSLSDEERRIMVELELERADRIVQQFPALLEQGFLDTLVKFSQLEGLRERGDYNCFVDATEEEIVPLIEPLKALIAKIKAIING